ncbi:hypothetical protein TCON_2074 [Astathelohania contejeani]|uniref:Uncharacterized protein n=1 Tax=Astathelohania contejeani TaxID=164912 RepID=A0ABQ7HX13_9MICR|nr:hypothetical protein TCON_2074 [Thelohania contejeani]
MEEKIGGPIPPPVIGKSFDAAEYISTLIPITSDNTQTFPPATQPTPINLWNDDDNDDDDDDDDDEEYISNVDILPDTFDMLLEMNGFSYVRFKKILNKYLTNEKDKKLKFNFFKIIKIIGTNKIENCVFQNVICFLSLFGISMYYFYSIFGILYTEYNNIQHYTKDDVNFLKVFRRKTLQAFEYMFKSQTNVNTLVYNSSLKDQESYNELCYRILFLQVKCTYIPNKYEDILHTMTNHEEKYNGLHLFLKLECDVFNLDIWNPNKLEFK